MNTVPNKRFTHAAALSLKQLSYLLAVSQTLNFTRAADLCCVTQSTLSSGLAELERLLGVQLVERDRQRVALTRIGLNMVERAQTLLASSEDLLNFAANACAPNAGHLSLGMIPTIAPFMLSKMLSHCRIRFPDLQLSIREAQTHMLLEHVHQGELDAAIIATPMSLGKLESVSLFEEQLSLIAHSADPICQQAAVSVEQLPTERLLLLEEGHCLRDHTLAACPNHPKDTEASSIQAATLNTMVQLVEAGMGYAMLPDMAIAQGMLTHTHVNVIPLTGPVPTRTITLVTRASHPRLSFLQHNLAPEIIGARP